MGNSADKEKHTQLEECAETPLKQTGRPELNDSLARDREYFILETRILNEIISLWRDLQETSWRLQATMLDIREASKSLKTIYKKLLQKNKKARTKDVHVAEIHETYIAEEAALQQLISATGDMVSAIKTVSKILKGVAKKKGVDLGGT